MVIIFDETLKIGGLILKNRVLTAPMAGITGRAFRDILNNMGAGLALTEMVSAQALLHDNIRTWQMLDMDGETPPPAIQIVGPEPQMMANAARILLEKGARLLDINMGCPAPKVIRNNEGAALLLDSPRAFAVARAVCDTAAAFNVPVTAKIRLGFDEDNSLLMAQGLEQAGIAALTVHGRLRNQFYAGSADYAAIARVAKALKIPVVGNGDIFAPEHAALLIEGGCAGVMIGRGMMGNPWLVRDTALFLAGKPLPAPPTVGERLDFALLHLRAEAERAALWAARHEEPEQFAVRSMRSHLACYIKSFPGSARLRARLNALDSIPQIAALFAEYQENLC